MTGAPPFRVLLVADMGACDARGLSVVERTARALDGLEAAADLAVVARCKGASTVVAAAYVSALAAITRRAGASFFVHERVALAQEHDACGVMIASTSDARAVRAQLGAERWLLASRHAGDALDGDALAAVDAVVLAPVFRSISKRGDDREPLGAAGLARDVARCARPVIALGGIDVGNVRAARAAGAAAVAVLGGVLFEHAPGAALAAVRASASG